MAAKDPPTPHDTGWMSLEKARYDPHAKFNKKTRSYEPAPAGTVNSARTGAMLPMTLPGQRRADPECLWLGGQRVLLLGQDPDDHRLVLVYIEAKLHRLPREKTHFERQPPEPAVDQQPGERPCSESRLWATAKPAERHWLARYAAEHDLPVPERYKHLEVDDEAVERAERRALKRRKVQPEQPPRPDPPMVPEHPLVEEKRDRVERQRQRRQQQRQTEQQLQSVEALKLLPINARIDLLLEAIWEAASCPPASCRALMR